MPPMAAKRLLPALGVCLSLAACDDRSPAPTAPSASAPAASASAAGDDDRTPALELTAPRPPYSLADLTDKHHQRHVPRAGWTPTFSGKSPAGDGPSMIRIAAFRKESGQQLETAVAVRCRKPDAAPFQFQPGEAYFRDGPCHMQVAVRLGIRNKSSESKRLLESLLAASAK